MSLPKLSDEIGQNCIEPTCYHRFRGIRKFFSTNDDESQKTRVLLKRVHYTGKDISLVWSNNIMTNANTVNPVTNEYRTNGNAFRMAQMRWYRR
jgi:hypothetical protein